jgi:hypothetical protein
MPTLIRFLVSLIVFTLGLLLTASVAAAGILLLTVWGARALWAKLTGRKVAPLVFRFDWRTRFGGVRHPAGEIASRTPRADAVSSLRRNDDVIDV